MSRQERDRRATVLLLLGLAIGVCACATGPSYPEPSPPFVVAPYWVAGDGLWLKWEAPYPAPAFRVRIYRGRELRWTLTPERDIRYYAAKLPVACGDSAAWRYHVTGMAAAQPFRLPPCPDAATAILAFLTDTQGDTHSVYALARQIAKTPAQLVLHGGDLVDLGSKKDYWIDYHAATQVYAGQLATAATIGNHEGYWGRDYAYYRRYLGPGTEGYRLGVGPVDVLVLNSEDIGDRGFDERQRRWLERELAELTARAESNKRWRIVLTHHSPFSSSMANAWFIPSERGTQLRQEYVPLFERYAVALVLSGHTHIYERSVHHGIQYVVGGPAGGVLSIPGAENPDSVLYLRERTYSLLLATPAELSLTTYDRYGERVDHFALRRGSSG